MAAIGKLKRPVEQVAAVRQNLNRCARPLADAKIREFVRRAAHGLRAAVGDRSYGMPKHRVPVHRRASGLLNFHGYVLQTTASLDLKHQRVGFLEPIERLA